jgi:predicted RecB family endonuclease
MKNLSQIAKTAWNIARAAAAKFGGSVVSFLSEAFKMAWRGETLGRKEATHSDVQELKKALVFAFNKSYMSEGKKEAISFCEEVANQHVNGAQIAATVARYKSCSEKQAYWCAVAIAQFFGALTAEQIENFYM